MLAPPSHLLLRNTMPSCDLSRCERRSVIYPISLQHNLDFNALPGSIGILLHDAQESIDHRVEQFLLDLIARRFPLVLLHEETNLVDFLLTQHQLLLRHPYPPPHC